jgi:integrase
VVSISNLIVLLSLKAGLRAGEIRDRKPDTGYSGWPPGDFESVLEPHDRAAKNRRGRRIPLHPDLKAALIACRRAVGAAVGPVITSQRGPKTTAVSIVNWFAGAFHAVGLEGCSSHSGRRTFITCAARIVHQAGHRCATSIQMTQRYIDSDTEAQRKPASLI